jgi:6-pyruvoyl-tetrahydropterin synthase related domain
MKQGSGVRGQGSERHWNRFIGPAIILLAAVVAVAPQLVRGNSCGHDFDFHLVSWLDCFNSWRHGIPYPHWTPSANYGAGEPRFVFYPPLTWMMGAALGLVMPWTFVPIALTFLLLAGTGLSTRALARQALDDIPATLAGCVALFSGYALFTAYERSAFAELAGGMWIPLVLLFALRDRGSSDSTTDTVWKRTINRSAGLLAVAVAGAWLSNPTVGLMACYLLAAVALCVASLSRSWAPLVRAATGGALGMGLVAAYLVPATWEQRWVDIHQVTEDPGQTLENNWLFAVHSNPSLALHDEVLRTASMIAVAMIAVALAGLLVSWLRGRLPGGRSWWVPLAVIPFAVLLLQFPFSRPLWNLLPELRFLQFPWRWLLVLEAPMAVFFVSALDCARQGRRVVVVAACVTVFLSMTALAERSFFQVCDDEDAVPGMLDVYRSGLGFPGTDEYEPIGADNSLLATNLPASCLVSDPTTDLGVATATADDPPDWAAGQGSCEATFAAAGDQAENLRIAANIPHPGYLVLRLRSYPAWHLLVNGQPVSSMPEREDGLMVVPVQQGPVELTAKWTTTADMRLGRWISGVSLLLLAGIFWIERKPGQAWLS